MDAKKRQESDKKYTGKQLQERKEELGGGKGEKRFDISQIKIQNLLCVSGMYWIDFFIS